MMRADNKQMLFFEEYWFGDIKKQGLAFIYSICMECLPFMAQFLADDTKNS
jgi:hypothetical protein